LTLNKFKSNTGTVLSVTGAGALMEGCSLVNNSAGDSRAIVIIERTIPGHLIKFEEVSFVSNTAGPYGVVYCDRCRTVFASVTFVGNTGHALFSVDGIVPPACAVSVSFGEATFSMTALSAAPILRSTGLYFCSQVVGVASDLIFDSSFVQPTNSPVATITALGRSSLTLNATRIESVPCASLTLSGTCEEHWTTVIFVSGSQSRVSTRSVTVVDGLSEGVFVELENGAAWDSIGDDICSTGALVLRAVNPSSVTIHQSYFDAVLGVTQRPWISVDGGTDIWLAVSMCHFRVKTVGTGEVFHPFMRLSNVWTNDLKNRPVLPL
jgi:hypothetical protein